MYWTEVIISVITSGVLIFLLERLFFRRKDKAESSGKEIENAHSIAELYNEIDIIVQGKTRPLEERLDKLLEEMDDIRKHWCCYRRECDDRMLYQSDDDELKQDNNGDNC